MTRPSPGRDGSGVVGVVLAAGAGTRMGRPKALVADDGDGWLRRAVAVLREGGCGHVVVVLGAMADRAGPLVADLDGVTVAEAGDWADGLSASLATGLHAVEERGGAVAVVTLVDLPDLVPAVVARLLARAGTGDDVLARAGYRGRPGHPVLIGRRHWASLAAGIHGDVGARDYLVRRGAGLVECGDLATGIDVDTAPADPECPRQDSNL